MAFVYNKPFVSIGGTDYVCKANKASLTVATVMADANTFCTPGLEIPSHEVWTFSVDWVQDYEAAGPWHVLSAIAQTSPRVATTIILRPDTGTIGATNPQATFDVWIPHPPFMEAEVGKSFTFTTTAVTVGDPVFAVL